MVGEDTDHGEKDLIYFQTKTQSSKDAKVFLIFFASLREILNPGKLTCRAKKNRDHPHAKIAWLC